MSDANESFFFRHRSVFSASVFTDDVHIVGCGGMGSHIAQSLVRMGVGEKSTIHLWDDDKYELHNLANQAITAKYVGERKVTALASLLRQINPNCKTRENTHRISKAGRLSGVVFVCIDTMSDRIQIMESIERNPNVSVVIETRMSSRSGVSYCFDPQSSRHIDCWWTHTYTDEEADEQTGCGGTVSIISAILGTTMLALRQFEDYARTGSAHGLRNRAYIDYDTFRTSTATWESEPDWD